MSETRKLFEAYQRNLKEETEKDKKRMLSGDETYVSKNQFNYNILGLIIDNKNKKFQFVNGQTMPLNKHKKLSGKALRNKARELKNAGYEEYKGYGSMTLDEDTDNLYKAHKDNKDRTKFIIALSKAPVSNIKNDDFDAYITQIFNDKNDLEDISREIGYKFSPVKSSAKQFDTKDEANNIAGLIKNNYSDKWKTVAVLAIDEQQESNTNESSLNEVKKYNIYATYGRDGVYNSKLVDTVDSQEQAADKVAELQATGVGASYEEVNESSLEDVRKDSKEKGLLTEDYIPSDIQLYMNTWGNYNNYGADVESINGGWMDLEQAKEFLEVHKEEEPFINDVENCPIEVSEYDNPWQVIEKLEYIENCDDKDAFLAILDDQNDNFEEAQRILEDGDYIFFPGVDNDYDLGVVWVDMVGGIDGVSNPENYIDYTAYNESWREVAEDSVREDNPDMDEDSDEFEAMVERYLDDITDEQLQIDLQDGNDLSDYFDYEALGRDLNFGGFYYTDTGAIETY